MSIFDNILNTGRNAVGAVGSGLDYIGSHLGSSLGIPGAEKASQKYYYSPAPDAIYPKTTTPAPSTDNYLNSLNSQIAALQAQMTPTLPSMDLTGLYNKAKTSAESAVNPYFTKQLNDFLGRQGELRKRSQADYQTKLTDLQDELKSFLEGSEVNRGRTTQDTSTAIGNTLADAVVNRTSEGRQFDIANEANKAQLADAGLTMSGLGKQQLYNITQTRAETGKQATVEKERKVEVQKLLKTRTFEDLARSDTQAGVQTEKGKKIAKVDLDREFGDLMWEESQTRWDLENKRQTAVINETDNQQRLSMQNYIASLKTPAQKEYAAKIYGSYL